MISSSQHITYITKIASKSNGKSDCGNTLLSTNMSVWQRHKIVCISNLYSWRSFFLSQIADKHNVLISMPCPLPSSAQSIMFIITLLMLTNSKLHWHRYLVSMSNYKIHNVNPSELHKDRSSSIWHNYHTGMMQHLVDNPRTEKVLLVLL